MSGSLTIQVAGDSYTGYMPKPPKQEDWPVYYDAPPVNSGFVYLDLCTNDIRADGTQIIGRHSMKRLAGPDLIGILVDRCIPPIDGSALTYRMPDSGRRIKIPARKAWWIP